MFAAREVGRSTLRRVSWQRRWLRSSSQSSKTIAEVFSKTVDGDNITVTGFVRSVRKQKRIAFAAVGDGTTLEPLQVVLSPERAESLSTGAAVSVEGQWASSPAGKQQASELRAKDITILGDNDAPSYPIQKKYHTPEWLRTVPHLRPRIPHNALLLRLRSQVISNLTVFFEDREFVQTHTPIITSSDCEGAGEVFTVESPKTPVGVRPPGGLTKEDVEEPFFKTPKYLTVSSQLHLEALALAVRNVWTLSPTFRAEKSDTARHLSEFYMLEAEMAFVDDANEVMDVIEDMVKSVTQKLAGSKIGRELVESRGSHTIREANEEMSRDHLNGEALSERWRKTSDGPWPRITYHQACQELQKAVADGKVTFDVTPSAETGLDTEHERYIAEVLGRRGPVFVTDYPKSVKPFYMAPSKGRPAEELGPVPTVACWDLLMPDVCEVVGGSMREHRLEELDQAMQEKGLSTVLPHVGGGQMQNDRQMTGESYDNGLQWYLDLRRYGSVSHGGFGLGFDRLLGYLAGVSNIRDVVTFPRYYKKCLC